MAEENEQKEAPKSVFGDLFESVKKDPSLSTPPVEEKKAEEVAKPGFMSTISKFMPQRQAAVQSAQMTQTVDKELPDLKAKKPRSVGGLLIRGGLLLLILVGGLSYVVNSANFKLIPSYKNPAKHAQEAQEQLDEVQAEIHVQNHLTAALLLEKFSSDGAQYLFNLESAESSFNSKNQKEAFAKAAEELKPQVLETLNQIQKSLTLPISAQDKVAAAAVITDLKADLGDRTQEIQDLESALNLMQSEDFRQKLLAVKADELDNEALQELLTAYENIDRSLSALLAGIRAQRIEWTAHLDEIEDLFKRVDPLFNTEFPGPLKLNSIQFEAPNNVLISGETVTEDSKNFTLVSNLMDILENSPSFEEVEERSYSKNLSEEDAYTGSFRLTLKLENQTSND